MENMEKQELNKELEGQVLELGPLYEKVKEIELKNKELFSNDPSLKTIEVSDVFMKISDRSNFSIDDPEFSIPDIKKNAIKIYGIINNIFVTDIYKEGIPKSVQDEIYKKLQVVVTRKKESLASLRKELDLAREDLRKAERLTREAEKSGRAAVESDNLLDAPLHRLSSVEAKYKATQKEQQILSNIKTKIFSGNSKELSYIQHTKIVLSILYSVKKILKENMTLEQVQESQIFSSDPGINERMFTLLNNIIIDVKKYDSSSFNTLLETIAETSLETYNSQASNYYMICKNVLNILVEMFEIDLSLPPIMKLFENRSLVPDDRKDEWDKAEQFTINQAKNYIQEIIDGRYEKKKIEGKDIDMLKDMLSFIDQWTTIQTLQNMVQATDNINMQKRAIISRFKESIKIIARYIWKNKDEELKENKLFENIALAVMFSTTIADGIYLTICMI